MTLAVSTETPLMPGCLFSNQDKAGLKGGVGKLVSHYEVKGLTTDR